MDSQNPRTIIIVRDYPQSIVYSVPIRLINTKVVYNVTDYNFLLDNAQAQLSFLRLLTICVDYDHSIFGNEKNKKCYYFCSVVR